MDYHRRGKVITVTDDDGHTDTDTAVIVIEPLPPEQPVADPNGPYMNVVNQIITFDGSGSSDSDGMIVNYTWDFGDGTKQYEMMPSHSYDSPGNYLVRLTVTDDDNLTDSKVSPTTIYEGVSLSTSEGLVMDTVGDGVYDSFLNKSSGMITPMQYRFDGNYLIDNDGDGKFESEFSPTTGAINPYKINDVEETDNSWIYYVLIVAIIIIAIVVILIKMGVIYFK
jgi:PKD repeat protein